MGRRQGRCTDISCVFVHHPVIVPHRDEEFLSVAEKLHNLGNVFLTYLGLRYGCFPHMGAGAQIGLSVAACAAWAVLLFGRAGLDFIHERMATMRQDESSESPSEMPEPSGAEHKPELVEV